jgi:opine dehydrogenase
MNISIIGAGNGGQAMAGHFSLLGHNVTLYNRSTPKLEMIKKKGGIRLSEAINDFAKIGCLTHSLEEAIADSNLIMVVTTADAHKELAVNMAPFLQDGQIVVLNPGRTLGALEFSKYLNKYSSKKIYIAEAQSLIYACRADIPGEVRIIGIKDKVLLASYPSNETQFVTEILNSIYDCFIGVDNVLITGLENIGAIFHPIIVMFNAATIERGQEFYFYNDMTPAVADFIVEADKERLRIGEAFGLRLHSASDWVSFAYKDIVGNDLCEKMKNNPAYYKILAPKKLNSRLLLEDIPTGILPLVELAKMAGVDVPILSSILNITQNLLKADYSLTGRTLMNLELSGFTKKSFLESL